ncbi:thermonuclease family protein [Miltoncostaea marina]|uniref:thermonuclease family protein n=1 Tax=Miltoncostaea marina TaxID=2843215 RepID=UPI001C3D500A|nr:thermonuclease family protein [Miltoncostaea marina]
MSRTATIGAAAVLCATAALAAGCSAGGERGGGVALPARDGHAATTAVRPAEGSRAIAAAARRRGVVVLRATVERVIDGDTVRVRVRGFQDTVRLIGIDTPETKHPQRGLECFGPEASRRLARLLPRGASVRLESDPAQGVRDRYGRFLGFVYRGGAGGPRSVNHAMVTTGHARDYVHDRSSPHPYAAAFAAAERRARAAGRGLWGPPCNGRTERRPATQAPAGSSPGRGRCDPGYTGACIPPAPPDLDCGDVPARRFRSVGSDPHRFDGDGDGIACES